MEVSKAGYDVAGWLPATSYAVTLRAGAVPVGGNLPLLTPKRWSFSTAPQPAAYGGPGYPLTFHHLISSLFTTGNEVAGGASKPGDRRSGLSFSYRLPYRKFGGDGRAVRAMQGKPLTIPLDVKSITYADGSTAGSGD